MSSTVSESELRRLARCLAADAELQIEEQKPLAPCTSYRIGGPTAVWAAPRTEAAVQRLLEAAHRTGAPLFILGRGSNVLVSDSGWPGVTLHIGDNLSGWEFAGPAASVRAGSLWMDLIQAAVARGLGGMEPMAGIPGSIGGALRMNAGAFGREIEAVTVAVRGFRRDGSAAHIDRQMIDFGYRRAPQLDDTIITSALFRFQPEPAPVLLARMQEILRLRAEKQPLEVPSCGSVFKRPPGYFAGALIEAAGLKGERIGGAEVSRKHAGFILNVGGATAADVHRLVRLIERRVCERFGVQLEREVRLVGEFDE
ncbi:MAG: UDP-N-acetylmuramate dehydrogenase [Desulfobacterales bacterium]|jgi:UDP-N-acetylmuramate dehydrogenase|nr:UDP-N-acetylmuramate dehydrogenase [Desulfobacterales bacterium]